MKFQRIWKMVITTPEETITIGYPLTVQFSIDRDTFAGSNTATFNIYNLGLATRNKVFQDKYRIDRIVFVDFFAGYNGQFALCFKGKVLEAYSGREGGANNVITTIQALDSDIIQSYSSHTFEEGTPLKDVYKTLAGDMPNLAIGAIGTLEGNLQTPLVINEKSFVAINKLTGGSTFVDLDKIHTLQDNEALADVIIPRITSESGLLGSPNRHDAQLDVKCLFSPEVLVGQLVEVESSVQTQFNGQFKVCGIHHAGTISAAICGTLETTLNLFIGALLPNASQIFTGVSEKQQFSQVKGQKVTPISDKVLGDLRAIQSYIKRNKTVPKQKLTNNIWWDEVIQNYSRQGEVPSIDILSNLYQAANALQGFLNKHYPGNKITITSGWRSKSYNATIRGASPTSNHRRGTCIDWLIAGVPIHYVYKDFKKYWSGSSYQGNNYIHCDTIRVGGNKGDL